jgi:peptide chain release factor 2
MRRKGHLAPEGPGPDFPPHRERIVGEARDHLTSLESRLAQFAKNVNIPFKIEEVTRIETRMSEPTFWNDQADAQKVVQSLKAIKNVVEPYNGLQSALADCKELLELAEAEKDEASLTQIIAEIATLNAKYEQLELEMALGGRYDRSNVYMNITPGAGGTESCDWAEMLFRMYTNYCAKAGYSCEIIEMQPGEEAGLKDCTLYIKGANAYGYLKCEMGTHRLVRISPFDGNARRQTSFTAVQITPEIDGVADVVIDEKDLRVDTYRAGGAGGQHVNKTDSAIRLTHLPTGLVVACQTERSQVQNRARAMKMLAAKIQQLRESERMEELKDLQGTRGTIGWGHQIRSYVLAPYQMVKDLRSGHETSQVQNVLDGDLQPFVDAYLRWVLGGRKDRKARDIE